MIETRQWKQTQIVTSEAGSGYSLAVQFRRAPDQAKLDKSRLGIAFVCATSPVQLPTVYDAAVPEATGVDTVGMPGNQQRTYYVALRAELLQIWIFDRPTGDVYGRFTPNGVLIDPSVTAIVPPH